VLRASKPLKHPEKQAYLSLAEPSKAAQALAGSSESVQSLLGGLNAFRSVYAKSD